MPRPSFQSNQLTIIYLAVSLLPITYTWRKQRGLVRNRCMCNARTTSIVIYVLHSSIHVRYLDTLVLPPPALTGRALEWVQDNLCTVCSGGQTHPRRFALKDIVASSFIVRHTHATSPSLLRPKYLSIAAILQAGTRFKRMQVHQNGHRRLYALPIKKAQGSPHYSRSTTMGTHFR